MTTLYRVSMERNDLRAALTELIKAMEKYGRHRPGCDRLFKVEMASLPKLFDESIKCTCGLQQAIDTAKKNV